jgi:hypothetical protein
MKTTRTKKLRIGIHAEELSEDTVATAEAATIIIAGAMIAAASELSTLKNILMRPNA